MADLKNNNFLNQSIPNATTESDISTLSKKYGVENESQSKNPANKYAPYNPPKNNTPAKTPKIVYNMNEQNPSVKIVYGNDETLHGPEGRKTIYEEKETESIAAKRRRNAAIQNNAGNGGQPYVKHVASRSSTKNDDTDIFKRTYKKNINKDVVKNEIRESINAQNAAKKVTTDTYPESDNNISVAHRHYEKTGKEKTADFFKSFIPWKGDKASEVVRKIIMNLAAIVVLVCFGYFINNFIDHQNYLKSKEEINSLAGENISNEDDELERQWAAIRAQYPDVDFPEGMNIRFAHLYATNQELVGWLHINNTNIDTAIPHAISDRETPNATDYYLYRNFYKEDDKYGIPYLEGFNTGTTLDKNNVIYGHNMSDGLSFTQINKYATIEGFKESPIIEYSTLFEDYYFKVYAAILTNGYPEADNGYLFNIHATHFPSEGNFAEFIEAIDERKLYDTGVDINEDDKLITLITCSYEIKTKNMGRFAVVGRLVRPGESTAVDTSKAVLNENVRYPQVWYDERGLTNPYKDAYRWIPQ